MWRKNYTEFDTEFVILDKRGKNCTRFGLGAPLSGGHPCCVGHFGLQRALEELYRAEGSTE